MSTPAFPVSPELGQLLALRRVRRGHVVLVGQGLLIDHGRRVPDYIREPLHDLINDGYLQGHVKITLCCLLVAESNYR